MSEEEQEPALKYSGINAPSHGLMLECGHKQRVTDFRFSLSKSGQEQHAVWCIICDAWREPTSED